MSNPSDITQENRHGDATSENDDSAAFLLNSEGLVISWEPTAIKQNGYMPSEVLGKHFAMFYAESDHDAMCHSLREALRSGKHVHEGWRIRKNKSKFFAHNTIIPLNGPDGKPLAFANITRDLTAQHEALERLNRKVSDYSNKALMHERRVRIITDTLPSIVSEFDTDVRFRFANSSCQKWFGKTESQLIGRKLKDELPEATYNEIASHLKTVLSGKHITYEGDHFSDGVWRTYLVNYVPEFDSDGSVVGFISLATDVTQLKQAKIAAEAANNAKSSFLANMAHEIRTPLGAVLGFSDLLLKENVTPQDRKIYQSAIVRNGSLLSNIINDVLDFAKIEAGMLQLDQREIGLHDILSDTLSTLEFHANIKKINLKTSIHCDAPRLIYTDPCRLKQILLNIIGNAIKFTNEGDVNIRVEPADRTQTGIRIIIEDSGIGISPDQAAKLFMPFKQSEDFSRRRFGGTGLGLALSRQMAQLLGGDVQLTKTELGKGSIFTISIDSVLRPKGVVESYSESRLTPSPSRPISADSQNELGGVKILVVDDSPDNQILVTRILQNAGASIVCAQNGAEALSESANSKFDVILMDLQMPIMDGYEAAQQLRKRGDKTPIIALTAHAMREEHDRCIAVGINAHLAKPINNQLLVSTLAGYRNHRHSASENTLH